MTRKYKAGDWVDVLIEGKWLSGVVVGEKWNNGNGGYWSMSLDNGNDVVVLAERIRRRA